MSRTRRDKIVLAVQPSSRGFGFVLFEGWSRLVDWGSYGARDAKNDRCLRRLERLFDEYEPDVLVVEDTAAADSRRRLRIHDLVTRLHALATEQSIAVTVVPRRTVLATFGRLGARNKHDIACAVAEMLPELALRLPPPRRPWMSQDERYALFDAAAFALTYYTAGRIPAGSLTLNDNTHGTENPGARPGDTLPRVRAL